MAEEAKGPITRSQMASLNFEGGVLPAWREFEDEVDPNLLNLVAELSVGGQQQLLSIYTTRLA